jgi:periplasmic divalent cation tolerance protein
MKIYYVTLNTAEEARQISEALLSQQLAVCTNWFPITCAYRWSGKITVEPETVLIIKTQSGYREVIEELIYRHINYTNLIAEIEPESINNGFLSWLNNEVPINSYQ